MEQVKTKSALMKRCSGKLFLILLRVNKTGTKVDNELDTQVPLKDCVSGAVG